MPDEEQKEASEGPTTTLHRWLFTCRVMRGDVGRRLINRSWHKCERGWAGSAHSCSDWNEGNEVLVVAVILVATTTVHCDTAHGKRVNHAIILLLTELRTDSSVAFAHVFLPDRQTSCPPAG